MEVVRARGTPPPLPGLAGGDNVPWPPTHHLQGWVLSTPAPLLHCAAVCCLLHLLGGTGAKITLRATRRHYSPPGQGDRQIIREPLNLKYFFSRL